VTDQASLPPIAPVTGRVVLKVRVPKRLRNLELLLIVFALGLSAVAMALVQFGALGSLDLRVLSYTGGLGLLVLLVHLAVRWLAPTQTRLSCRSQRCSTVWASR